jgi:5'(3')-deoxyribonucleotidase
LRIILDIDDVCADLVTVWLNIYNVEHEDNLKREDITDWDIGSFTKIGKKFYDYLDQDFNLYWRMNPIKDALWGVETLRKLNHEIIFCTVYDYYNRKWDWLNRNRFTNNPDEYVVAHNKNLIKGDLIIDDNWNNFSKYDGEKFLFDAPWNQQYSTIYRVKDWNELIDKFILLDMIETNQ